MEEVNVKYEILAADIQDSMSLELVLGSPHVPTSEKFVGSAFECFFCGVFMQQYVDVKSAGMRDRSAVEEKRPPSAHDCELYVAIDEYLRRLAQEAARSELFGIELHGWLGSA